LRRCLDSVAHQADDVLVVDNGSPHGSAGTIASERGARSVRLRRNDGFASGVNCGISETGGDVVAFLDDGAVAGDGWVTAATGLLEDPTIGAVAPRVALAGRYLEVLLDDEPWFANADARPRGRQLRQATLGGVDVLPALLGPGIHDLETGPAGDRWRWTSGRTPFYVPLLDLDAELTLRLNFEPVRASRVVDLLSSAGSYLREDGSVGDVGSAVPNDAWLDATEERFALGLGALVTTQEALGKVGAFEQRYRTGYEDTDWCWRARLMGLRMFYDPAVTVRQAPRSDVAGFSRQRLRHLAERNRILTLLRNAPLDVAMREAWRKRREESDDGVADLLPRVLPRALGERELLRRHWMMRPREVFERWAGVDVPTAI